VSDSLATKYSTLESEFNEQVCLAEQHLWNRKLSDKKSNGEQGTVQATSISA
jgi:hypothetical protein